MVPLASLFERWPALKDFHDVLRQIRANLASEAETALQDKLEAAPFISLALKAGKLPEKNSAQERKKQKTARHGRQWEPFDVKDLRRPTGKKVLSADVGTGKTTFLYWLTKELLNNKSNFVPLFLPCSELQAYDSWEDLKGGLIKRHKRRFLESDLEFFFESGPTVLLCDGLDQIRSGEYTELARRILRISDDRAVLIASRPSAVLSLENDGDFLFLTLQPFLVGDQRRYFGEHYSKAKRLASMSAELAQVPMLAYMIRRLIDQGEAAGIKTRTGLYGRFMTHVLTTHQANQPFVDKPSWTNKIRASLCLLAYRAVAEREPQLQRVGASFYESLPNPVPLEQLAKFGLVNLVLERGEYTLLFTHLSFQEFLAAQYAKEHQVAYDQVLQEHWNPKWAEVMRFLAGLTGESLMQQILTRRDNVIHSNLFLGARCAHEVNNLSPRLKKYIEGQLLALAERPPFDFSAIAGLDQLHDARLILPFLAANVPEKRLAAVNALGQSAEELDAQTIHAIVARLQDKDPWVRTAAIEALGNLGDRLDSRTMQGVAARLEDKHPWVRQTAVEALGRLGERLDSETMHAIAARLENKNPEMRRVAIEALGNLGDRLDSRTMQAVAARLEDNNFGVRRTAVEALGRLGERLDSETMHAIAARLENKNPEMRRVALKFWGTLGTGSTPKPCTPSRHVWRIKIPRCARRRSKLWGTLGIGSTPKPCTPSRRIWRIKISSCSTLRSKFWGVLGSGSTPKPCTPSWRI